MMTLWLPMRRLQLPFDALFVKCSMFDLELSSAQHLSHPCFLASLGEEGKASCSDERQGGTKAGFAARWSEKSSALVAALLCGSVRSHPGVLQERAR